MQETITHEQEITIPKIDPDEVIDFMNIDETDYSSFTMAQRLRHFEVEGYVVLPDVLDAKLIAKLKAELADIPMRPKPYSEYQTTGAIQPQWFSRTTAELIGHPPMIEFFTALMGPDIVFTRGFFQRTNPGSPGISVHTDGQPHGSSIFDYEGSSPRLLRVLYYPRRPYPKTRTVSTDSAEPSLLPRTGKSLRALQVPSGRTHPVFESRISSHHSKHYVPCHAPKYGQVA